MGDRPEPAFAASTESKPRAAPGPEVPTLRTRTSRTFQASDGELVARVWGAAVNFKDGAGRWQKIDNRLERKGAVLENRAGQLETQLPSSLAVGPVRAGLEGEGVAFKLAGASDAPAEVDGATATYAGALPNVDVEYEGTGEQLKETLTLKEGAQSRYAFDLTTTGDVSLRREESGAYSLLDDAGKVVMVLAAPFVYDGEGKLGPENTVDVSIEHDGAKRRLILQIDEKWLGDALERGQVVLDPVVSLPQAVQDTAIESSPGWDNADQHSDIFTRVGGDSTYDTRALLKFDVDSAVPQNAQIHRSTMYLYSEFEITSGTRTFSASAARTPWTNQASWNTRDGSTAWATGGGDPATPAESSTTLYNAYDWSDWNLTTLTRKWVTGTANHGVVVKAEDNATAPDNYHGFASSEHPQVDHRPSLDVSYRRPVGQRPDHTYLRQTLTEDEDAAIDLASGNFLLSSRDLTVPGTGVDLSVGRVYQSQQGEQATGSGAKSGFTFDQWIDRHPDDGAISFSDASGANYTLEPISASASTYRAPGLGATMTRNADDSYDLVYDNDDRQLHFPAFATGENDSLLAWEEDSDDRRVTYARTGSEVEILDASGRTTVVSYSQYGPASKVRDPDGRETTYDTTDDGALSEADRPGTDTDSHYGYSTDGKSNMTSVQAPEGETLALAYDVHDRVTSMTRTSAEAPTPQTWTLTYPSLSSAGCTGTTDRLATRVVEPSGSTVTYCFDAQQRGTNMNRSGSTQLDDGVVDVGDRLHTFGDFDGDGRADIGLVDRVTGARAVALGRGDGTFAPETTWGSFAEPIDRIAAGNVDGDDSTDAPTADDLVARSETGALRVTLSNGSSFAAGTTAGMTGLQSTWPAGRSLGLADVDGDTRLDLWGVDTTTRALIISYSRGPAFDSSSSWGSVAAGREVAMRDLDGDGLDDLVTYDASDGVVRFRRSDGEDLGLQDEWGEAVAGASFALGDVDANGLQDPVLRRPDTGSTPGSVTARLSSRNEGFVGGPVDVGSLAETFTLAAVDLTADGKADVVGTRVQNGQLLLRSAGSTVPEPDDPDPTPADPNPVEETPLARAAAEPVPAALMMSEDSGLSNGTGILGTTPAEKIQGKQDLMAQMGYLGSDRLRAIAYWGRMDRLRPSDEQTGGLVAAAGQPETAAEGRNGGAQTESNPPVTARRFRLRRDIDDPSVDLTGTQADRQPEWIAGEWRIIENRWYPGNHEALLQAAIAGEKTLHLTITGGNVGFTECGSDDSRRNTLQVRGCTSTPTGLNPNPRRAAHAIAEITAQARETVGSRLTSVGVWNEPNLRRGTFLSITPAGDPKNQLDTSRLYGRIYAETYSELRDRDLLGAGNVRIAFGELTSGLSKSGAHPRGSKLRSRTPAEWTTSALDEAKGHPGAGWDSGRVRADIMAIHPYQHVGKPWERSGRYPWGVNGVGRPTKRQKGSAIESPSLKGFLSANAADNFRRVEASGATAPDIWATEFGYYNSKAGGALSYAEETLSLSHPETTRARYLTYRNGDDKGALPNLTEDGNVKVIAFWEVLEDPLSIISPRAESTDDYGFIGSATVGQHDSYRFRAGSTTTSWPLQANYEGQFLQLRNIRVYGKALTQRPKRSTSGAVDERYDGLQWPQNRRTACAIRAWRGLSRNPVADKPKC